MVFPPVRHGASEPTPVGLTKSISWLSATTVFGADASASVMRTGPVQNEDAVALHGVKYAIPPVGERVRVFGDTIPAPPRDVSSTTVSVDGSPIAFVPSTT